MYDLGMSSVDKREPLFDFPTPVPTGNTGSRSQENLAADLGHVNPPRLDAVVVSSPSRPQSQSQSQPQQVQAFPEPHMADNSKFPNVDYLTSLDGITDGPGHNLNLRTVMLLSGIVVAVTIASAGGFWLTKAGDENAQLAAHDLPVGTTRKNDTAWPSPNGKKVRNIDLTQTGSITKSNPEKDAVRLERDFPPIPTPVGNTPNNRENIQHGELYQVQPGDTISAIGRKYNLAAKELMAINNITDPRKLKPGMKLVISNPAQ